MQTLDVERDRSSGLFQMCACLCETMGGSATVCTCKLRRTSLQSVSGTWLPQVMLATKAAEVHSVLSW